MSFNQKKYSRKYIRKQMKLIIRICIRNGFLYYQNYKLKKLCVVRMQSEFPVCYHELHSNWQYPVLKAKR